MDEVIKQIASEESYWQWSKKEPGRFECTYLATAPHRALEEARKHYASYLNGPNGFAAHVESITIDSRGQLHVLGGETDPSPKA